MTIHGSHTLIHQMKGKQTKPNQNKWILLNTGQMNIISNVVNANIPNKCYCKCRLMSGCSSSIFWCFLVKNCISMKKKSGSVCSGQNRI